MKNKDKYKKYFSKYEMCNIYAPWYKAICCGTVCKGCVERLIKWSEQEAPLDITGLEEKVLKKIRRQFKYIARAQDGRLFLYCEKPKKEDGRWVPISLFTALPLTGMFDWIRFEDGEPVYIDDFVER